MCIHVCHSYVYKLILIIYKLLLWYVQLMIYNYWTMFSRKIILHFIHPYFIFMSRSHDHPNWARMLTSAGPPFSNNLLVARPWNSVEKDLAEWTVWSLIPQWWSESHGYIVVQWHVRIYTSHIEFARRRRKCTRIRPRIGVNNTDKHVPFSTESNDYPRNESALIQYQTANLVWDDEIKPGV